MNGKSCNCDLRLRIVWTARRRVLLLMMMGVLLWLLWLLLLLLLGVVAMAKVMSRRRPIG